MSIVLLGLVLAPIMAPTTGPIYPRIANCYAAQLTPTSTDEDIAEIARYGLLIGGSWADWSSPDSVARLHANMDRVRALNPEIIILSFAASAPYADPKDATFPESGWLLQPNGEGIEGWPGTKMTNLTRPEVIDWLVNRAVGSVRWQKFDGVFIDCMSPGFDWWACNIESGVDFEIDADEDGVGDGRAELDAQWRDAKTEFSRRVREELGPDVPFMTNQGGPRAFEYMNGILFEDDCDYVLDGRMSWEGVVSRYLERCTSNYEPLVTTLVSSSGIEPPYNPWQTMTEDERNAMLERGRDLKDRMRFGLATTLMGDGFYAYDLHTRWRGQRWWYPEYDVPLGYPSGLAEEQSDGTWRREFTSGTVIVNPTMFDAQVTMPSRYQDASSGKVDDSFIIPSQDGRILLPSEADLTAGTLPDPEPVFAIEGTEPSVERDGRVLLRSAGLAAVFDETGRMLTLTDGKNDIATGLQAVLVTDDRWRDFAYADATHAFEPEGLVFRGRRQAEGMELAYTQTVTFEDGALHVAYDWEAVTDVDLHAWRHQLDLPVATYADARCSNGTDEVVLPLVIEDQPSLLSSPGVMVVSLNQMRRLRVEWSVAMTLVDERHYGVDAYRVGAYPPALAMQSGDTCAMVVSIKVD